MLTDAVATIRFDGNHGYVLETVINREKITYLLRPFHFPVEQALDIIQPKFDCDLKPFPGGWRGYLTPFRKRVINPFDKD